MKKVMLFDLSRGKFDATLLTSRGITITDNPLEIERVVVAAGDGGMIHTINDILDHHPELIKARIPFSGIHYGTVGFLMNRPTPENFDDLAADRLEYVEMRMLMAEITYPDGRSKTTHAFNDFYMERIDRPQAKIRVSINGDIVLDPLMGDGVIVSGPAGSTAYNLNAGGPILALESRDMVVTGICPSRAHNWKTTGLHETERVTFEPLETNFRPVRFCGDDKEFLDIAKAVIGYSDIPVVLAFATSEKFRERRRQFQFGKQVF